MNNLNLLTTEERGQSQISPSVLAFEKELENTLLKFAKRDSSGDGYHVRDDIKKRKLDFSKLFKEFKPRLQLEYYVEKLMQIGSFLYSIKAFQLAKFQCFTRYLQNVSSDFTFIESVAGYSFETFQEKFFPNGLDDAQAVDTIKVLYEDTMCSYELLIDWDPKLQNMDSVQQCLKLLKILMLTTQLALQQESFSWLVYNGTIHIYTISRQLMITGRSSMVLEYMLWACMCMEGSIPLLTLKYVPWRSTLYAGVCLCYIDCKESQHAETFARRAVKKIAELADIEQISTSVSTPESKAIFQAANVKINVFIFQRLVFESRKKPKAGFLRPKIRVPLKEALYPNWPRNQTERQLGDLFEGTAAQFLAILHTLGEPHRRTLQCKAPTGSIDDITLDIYPELFVAGMDLISGGSNARVSRYDPEVHPSCIELAGASLLDLSEQGVDGVPLPFVVKFIKLAFSYEQWEVLEALLQPFMTLLKTQAQVVQTPAYAMSLQLLAAMEPFFNTTGRKQQKKAAATENATNEYLHGNKGHGPLVDELLVVANILNGFSSELPKSALPYVDVDMVIDAALFLWNRCKPFFQRVVSSNQESCRHVLNDKDCDKWLFILLTIDNVLHWSGLSDVDPIVAAEVALKLALVLESRAASVYRASDQRNKTVGEAVSCDKADETIEDEECQAESKPYQVVFPNTFLDLLVMAFNILESGVQRVSEAREKMAELFGDEPRERSETNPDSSEVQEGDDKASDCSKNNIDIEIIHLELLFNLMRILAKLETGRISSEISLNPEKEKSSPALRQSQAKNSKSQDTSWAVDIMVKRYNKLPITRALLLMHTTQIQESTSETAQQNLKECYDIIRKCQTQEKVLASRCRTPNIESVEPTAVPPPPILVFRCSSRLTFKPAPFKPQCKTKVYWYRLFACSASGSNVKVRLNDADLVGTGVEIPAGSNCRFFVTNLVEGERYVFAVAAYDKNGDLIGGGIGPTSQAYPASHPMPMIMAWAYLTKAAYSCGVHDIAKTSAQFLWKYFIPDESTPSHDSQLSLPDGELTLGVHRCDPRMLAESNQALVRQLIRSVFISVDIAIQNGKLYCDSLCDYGTLLPGQIQRMRQCEKMLLVLQISLWLNDNNLVLQSVTRCYGLIAPLIQLKIPSKPVVQVLLQCYAVIQEIPVLNRFRKNSMTYDSLYRLITVITYYLTKVLPLCGEQELANTIRDYGRKLLSVDAPIDPTPSVTASLTNTQDAITSNQASGTKSKSKGGKMKTKKTKGGGVIKVVAKPEQSNKTGSQKNEFASLENVYTKRACEAMTSYKTDYELTGGEDPVILASYVTALTANDGYREVIKFKRRTKYLQYFVLVAEKALAGDFLEKVLEWSNETEIWLNKRNDILLPFEKAFAGTRPSTDPEGDETKNRKYGTAIVEYGKPSPRKTKSMKQLLETLAHVQDRADTTSPPSVDGKPGEGKPVKPVKAGKSRPQATSTSPTRTPAHVPRIIRKRKKRERTGDQYDLIRAIESLQCKLPPFWKTEGKKRKLRAISTEENPWRCQWNIIRALASFRMFLKNTKKTDLESSTSSGFDTSTVHPLDTEWFGFDVSGVLIRQRNSILKDSSTSFKNLVISFTQQNNRQSPLKKKEQLRIDDETEYLRYVYNASKYLSKAVVLSYRCKCWGLLQNTCSQLWNMRQRLYEYTLDISSQITEDVLYEITWSAFYFAADTLLDMLLYIKQTKKEQTLKAKSKVSKDSDKNEVSFWGDIESEKGGSDLVFEQYLDDQTTADVAWIKRIIMHCMEVLFYKEKWERLADIILRFNALSRGRYAEKVLPLLAFAQEKLLEKAHQCGGVSTSQPSVVLAAESGKPEGLQINLNAGNASFDPAVHIDPKGHDVYSNDNNAKRLFCVPVDKTSTSKLLKESVEMKHCAARALHHSRELFLRYLAGLGEHLKKSSSRVAFASSEDATLTATPSNIHELKFDKIDDVEKCPLTSSQLAVVITSYDKTIEMLQFHGRRALLAQAMNEIGNIMLHIGNKRSAYRWWQMVLDTILAPVSQSGDSQSHNRYHDAVHVDPSVLLKKRGIWGCQLAAVTAVNIARYIQTDNADKRLDYCCVAASLLKAMFSCSLPHPTSCCDFALYDIGNGFSVGTLIPGINLFSDPFRCDAKVLLSSTVWLAEELIDTGHYLMVLPLLTLARYISSDVFECNHWVTKVLILRIRALTKAGMYSRSYHVLNALLLGKNVKRSAKNQTIDGFHCDRPLSDASNIQALTNLISNRISPVAALSYGTEASRCLMLEQARLLVEIAASVYAIPRNLKTQLVEKLNGENLEASVLEASAKTASKPVVTIFDDDDITQVTIKGYLLAGAELLLEELRFEILGPQKDLKDFLEARGHLFKPIDFKTLILVELELASILHQCFDSLRAAKVIYECMRALEDASVLLEHDAIRLGSAWTAFSRSPDPAKTPDSLRSDVGSVKSEIDANLWLTCRIKMVEYLLAEENGVGRIAGFSRSVVALTGSAEQHCEQGLDESDAFGHSEIVAQLQFAALLLKLRGGCVTQEDFDRLKGTIEMLQNLHPLSMQGTLLLVKLLIYCGDLAGSFGATSEECCESYRKAETILLEQILALGHNFQSPFSDSSRSNRNIFLPQNMVLAETKLRLGRDKLQNLDSSSETKNILDVLTFLTEALGIVTDAQMDQNPLESEYLFLIGVCQNYLWIKGDCSPTSVIMSFVDAIKKTYSFDHNLDLMRKCYEQLALFYIAKTQRIKEELAEQKAKRTSPKLSRAVTKLARKDPEGKIKDKQDILIKRETKKELRAMWIAARAMAALTAVINTRGQLHGNVTGLLIPKAAGEKIPLSVIYDLLGSVSIKSEEGECMQDDGIITMDSWINGLNTVQLTWNHLLSYIEYLQRQVSYQSLGVKTHGGPLFRWPKLLKLHRMHEFLGSELEVYVAKGFGVKSSPLLLLPDLPLKPNEKDSKLKGRSVDEAGENEISISWVRAKHLRSGRFKAESENVECIYAFNNKAISGAPITGVNAGKKTVLRETLIEVHEQLQSLLEMTENEQISLQAKVSKPDAPPPVSSGTPQTGRKKKVSSMRTLSSSAGRRASEAQSYLRGCVNAVNEMMKLPQMSEKKDIPFEASQSNVRILESVFNPSRGYIGKIPDSMHQWISSMFV